MEQSRIKRILPFPSIRTQLLIISLVVLVLPWVGVQTIRDMEGLLRQQQVHNLMTMTTTVSNGLSPVHNLVSEHNMLSDTTPAGSEIVLSEFSERIYVDGYADDWPDQRIKLHYHADNALQDGRKNSGLSFYLSGTYQHGKLLLLLDVDDNVLYQTTNPSTHTTNGDRLLLGIGDQQGNIHKQYIISSNSPGWLSVVPMDEPGRHETRIQAELQKRRGGYTIEVALPAYMVSRYLSVQLVDRDNDDASFYAYIGNTPVTPAVTGLIIRPYERIRSVLERYSTPGQKIILTDRRGYILASDGDTRVTPGDGVTEQSSLIERMYRLLILADTIVSDDTSLQYRLDHDYVRHALKNQSDHLFTRDVNGTGLLSVAAPLRIDNQVHGALIIQQSTDAISDVRYRALMKIFLTSMSAIAVISVILLLYATILIRRIRKLNRQLREAVTDDGRLQRQLEASFLGDEIGELNRGISSMISRLQAYQQYLETMASKLSHELRTPLTVVQSSLENLRLNNGTTSDEPLLIRADEGLHRLKMILANLTEASRLENALKTTEVENFDLAAVVQSCIEGYRQAFSDVRFEYRCGPGPYYLDGSADLIAQMMDKLISNAMDFHLDGTAIQVTISDTKTSKVLCVNNEGETIDRDIISTLFDSMVSDRKSGDGNPHLGLGLYIVRLIAHFHGGTPSINSDNGLTSVCVSFRK